MTFFPDDTHAPPSDLDVPAARQAARQYAAAVARGVPQGIAWAEAVDLFALHHPSWPRPLVEREAARTVGALAAWQRDRAEDLRAVPPRATPPRALLCALASPMEPETADEEEAPVGPFRIGARIPAGAFPLPAKLPLGRFPGPAVAGLCAAL
ncbi:hypothetical protein [Muricoccus radiodurans]|uniref:hypothetical protein n=1 Tax=Muricoccus radiodurans TaxID=2231721 RepID=UPI003CEF1AAA